MSKIISNILSLNQGVTKYGKAPHKPVLLLAVIESFENGEIIENWIEVSESLVQRFLDIWNQLVKTPHIPTFALPFFHLKNEKGRFWNLITYPGKEIPTTKSKSIKSYRALSETIAAAQLSEEMFIAFSDPVKREKIKAAILEKYFGKQLTQLTQKNTYSSEVRKQILSLDPEQNYARKIKQSIEEQPKEVRDEFVVLRSSVFRKAILEIYDNQCAVSGLKVADAKNRSLVDACHITPFMESYNDSIRNGLALSPTFHRAFDRGLIAVSDDFRVMIHPSLNDFNPEAGIVKYSNQEIILPKESRYHPAIKHFRSHRQRFGF